MKKSSYSFVAYIDESGDDGLDLSKQGTSKWLVISALIMRASRDMDLIEERPEKILKMISEPQENQGAVS